MKQYRNYIFDLYGTLIDIETDESSPTLWKKMAGLYSVYGADYTFNKLRARYAEMVVEEERRLGEETGYSYPEIKLEKVFARLYIEAEKRHESDLVFNDCDNPEQFMNTDFICFISNAFRVLSRKKCRLFTNTKKVLDTLKGRGCGIYLLSNAQRIFTMPEIEQTGIAPYFDKIYISSDFGARKPEPAFMQKLLSDNGLKTEDCVMVGNDYDSDIGIAAAVGMDSIFLNTFNLSEQERISRLDVMRKRVGKPDYTPVLTVEDGDIGEILRYK